MRIVRRCVTIRPHVVVQIEDGTGEQWIGPHLDEAVVKFEIVVDGMIDATALREKALAAGAVHVYPIVARRAPAPPVSMSFAPAADPVEALVEYALIDPPPTGVDFTALLREML